MADETRAKVAEQPTTGGDDAEIRTRPLLGFIFGLLVVLAIVHVWVAIQLDHFKREALAHDPPPLPVLQPGVRREPPPPRLQVAPQQDLEELRAAEETALHSYGWVDRRAGRARVPIERAMDLLASGAAPESSVTVKPPAARPRPVPAPAQAPASPLPDRPDTSGAISPPDTTWHPEGGQP